MAGKVIYICDDSIIGFSLIKLLQLNKAKKTNKTFITKQDFESIKQQVINYAKKHSAPSDVILTSETKRECFSRRELQTGEKEIMYIYNPVNKTYTANKSLEYLQSAYNISSTPDNFSFNMYTDKSVFHILNEEQSER